MSDLSLFRVKTSLQNVTQLAKQLVASSERVDDRLVDVWPEYLEEMEEQAVTLKECITTLKDEVQVAAGIRRENAAAEKAMAGKVADVATIFRNIEYIADKNPSVLDFILSKMSPDSLAYMKKGIEQRLKQHKLENK